MELREHRGRRPRSGQQRRLQQRNGPTHRRRHLHHRRPLRRIRQRTALRRGRVQLHENQPVRQHRSRQRVIRDVVPVRYDARPDRRQASRCCCSRMAPGSPCLRCARPTSTTRMSTRPTFSATIRWHAADGSISPFPSTRRATRSSSMSTARSTAKRTWEPAVNAVTALLVGSHKNIGTMDPHSMKGDVDDIRVYDATLTDDQAAAIYAEQGTALVRKQLGTLVSQADALLAAGEVDAASAQAQALATAKRNAVNAMNNTSGSAVARMTAMNAAGTALQTAITAYQAHVPITLTAGPQHRGAHGRQRFHLRRQSSVRLQRVRQFRPRYDACERRLHRPTSRSDSARFATPEARFPTCSTGRPPSVRAPNGSSRYTASTTTPARAASNRISASVKSRRSRTRSIQKSSMCTASAVATHRTRRI